jgi:Diguanylate cyclase, GGDEF domain
VALVQWVTQDEEQFEQRYRDLFDAETGLAGGVLLLDRLAVGLARARRFNRYVLVVWFEIKPPAPHDAPARVRALAAALRDAVRPDDTVARVGDWEFAVLCNDLAHEDAVERIVRRLHTSIRKAMHRADGDEPLARIGTALGQPNQSAQLVLARARKNLRALRSETVSAVVA